MEYQVLVLLHVILAILIIGPAWIGSMIIIPWAFQTGRISVISSFYRRFYKTSHAIMAFQLLIGFRLAMIFLPMDEWFTFSTSISLSIILKLLLWIVFFGWLIVGKRKGLSNPEKVTLPVAKQFFLILSILGLAMIVTGLNFRLDLF